MRLSNMVWGNQINLLRSLYITIGIDKCIVLYNTKLNCSVIIDKDTGNVSIRVKLLFACVMMKNKKRYQFVNMSSSRQSNCIQ